MGVLGKDGKWRVVHHWVASPSLPAALGNLEMEESSIAAFDQLIPGPAGAFDMLTIPFPTWEQDAVFLVLPLKKMQPLSVSG